MPSCIEDPCALRVGNIESHLGTEALAKLHEPRTFLPGHGGDSVTGQLQYSSLEGNPIVVSNSAIALVQQHHKAYCGTTVAQLPRVRYSRVSVKT